MRQVLCAPALLIAASACGAPAQTVVTVEAGQTLTESHLSAGHFDGQKFSLSPKTTFEINGGGAIGPVGHPDPFAFDGSTVNINDGGLFDSQMIGPEPSSAGSVSLNLRQGGDIGDGFEAASGSLVSIAGGLVGDAFEAIGGSSVMMTGGAAGEAFTIGDASTATISGGSIGSFLTADSGSQVDISGGSIGNFLLADQQSEINIAGGHFPLGGFLRADRESTLNLSVLGMSLNGEPVGLSQNEPVELPHADGATLSGHFADDAPFELRVFLDRGSTLTATLVPAPATLSIFAIAAAAGLRRSRR